MAAIVAPPDQEPQEASAAKSVSALELGVIKEARRRQRRRRVAVLAGVLVAAVLALIIVGGGRGRTARPAGSQAHPRASVPALTSPAAVFARDPYMGVACGIPNSVACDRVGLAVWLRRPAKVVATIAGASLKLNDPHWNWSYVSRSRRKTFYVYAGFLQPAGLTTRLHVAPESKSLTWLGSNAPSPPVRFRIDYGHGDIVMTQEPVFLSAGWG